MVRAQVTGGERLAGLDTFRAVATAAVVLLHSAVPYASSPMPGLVWPVQHLDPSGLVNALFWGIEGCVMPAFFWLSGYGAAQSLAARGAQAFWKQRWQRIGKPLLIFAAVLLPIEFYLWLTGWALDGQLPWRKLQSLKLERFHEGLWGLSHLWYLEYLLLYCGLLVLWESRQLKHVPWRWQRFGVGAGAVAVLWWSPETIVGFQHSFFPVPAKFVFSGLFFAGGVMTHWQRTQHTSLRFPTPVSAAALTMRACLAVGLFAAAFPLLTHQALEPLKGIDRLALAVALAVFATTMPCVLWDACIQQRRPGRTSVRFISAASYWTYLLHHPVAAACHIALRPTGWTAPAQFLITALVTLFACWTSYEWLVRGRAIGALLGETRAIAVAHPVEHRRAA